MTDPAPEPGRPRLTLPGDDYRLFDVLRQLTARWRFLAATTFGTGAFILAIASLQAKRYTAVATIAPEEGSARHGLAGGLGGLAGLAGSFSQLLGGGGAQSPRYYAQVVRSRTLGERLLLTRFADPRPGAAPGDSVPLLTLLRVRGKSRADSLERGLRRLKGRIRIRIDNQTRMLDVYVEARSPDLAAAVANRVVVYLNDFNAQTRQSQARERRRFVEERIAEIGRGLRDSEDGLRRFYETNRSWEQSAEMTFEESRLRRQVAITEELYGSLRREYESARIEEVNDTPVLTVIDPAVPPTRRSSPRRRLALMFGVTIGFLGGVLWVLGKDYWERARER